MSCGYDDIQRALEPAARWELGGVTATFLRRLLLLAGGADSGRPRDLAE